MVKAAKGSARLGSPLLGSTALHLVRKAPVPVWLIDENAGPSPRRIMALLASDPASDERQALDRKVLEVACSLAEASGAELRVGVAWDAPGESLLRRRMPEDQIREYVEGARRQAEDGLGRALEPFGSSIDPARVHLVRGLPALELVALASRHADLAVIGTAPPSGGLELPHPRGGGGGDQPTRGLHRRREARWLRLAGELVARRPRAKRRRLEHSFTSKYRGHIFYFSKFLGKPILCLNAHEGESK